MSRRAFAEKYAAVWQKRAKNAGMLTEAQYNAILADLIAIRGNGGPFNRRHYPLFNKYDVLTSGKVNKIIRKKTLKEVVHETELYDVIHNIHTSQGHCGRDKTWKLIKDKFANIPRMALSLYLETSRTCEEKRRRQSLVPLPLQSSRATWQNVHRSIWLTGAVSGRLDSPTRILNYQDHLSKFVVLRPLRTKSAEEVAFNLVDFCLFGAPNVIQVRRTMVHCLALSNVAW